MSVKMKKLIYSISFTLISCCAFCTSCSQNESYTEDLDDIANNDTISNDSINGYRIYEYDVETAASSYTTPIDILGWKYKKAYFDNKGILITSATGDFGANDTIMIHSDLYQSRVLLYTNENNDIYRVFDGEYLLDIHYQDNTDYTIFCFKEECDSILFSIDFESDELSSAAATRGVKGGKTLHKTLDELMRKYDRLGKSETFEKEHPFYSYLIDNAKLDAPVEAAKSLANTLAEIDSNPELHNQKILLNSLEILGDVVGVFGTAVGGTLSGGALWAALGINIASLVGDCNSLVNEIFPSNELYDRYKEYYKEKYGVYFYTKDATNITSTNATLNGTFYCAKNIGRTYFRYWKFLDDTTTIKEIDANINGNSLSASISDLSPNTEYIYYTVYECIVDGMTFRYVSDDCSNFETLPTTYKFRFIAKSSSSKFPDADGLLSVNSEDYFRCNIKGYTIEYSKDGDLKHVWEENTTSKLLISVVYDTRNAYGGEIRVLYFYSNSPFNVWLSPYEEVIYTVSSYYPCINRGNKVKSDVKVRLEKL